MIGRKFFQRDCAVISHVDMVSQLVEQCDRQLLIDRVIFNQRRDRRAEMGPESEISDVEDVPAGLKLPGAVNERAK